MSIILRLVSSSVWQCSLGEFVEHQSKFMKLLSVFEIRLAGGCRILVLWPGISARAVNCGPSYGPSPPLLFLLLPCGRRSGGRGVMTQALGGFKRDVNSSLEVGFTIQVADVDIGDAI